MSHCQDTGIFVVIVFEIAILLTIKCHADDDGFNDADKH